MSDVKSAAFLILTDVFMRNEVMRVCGEKSLRGMRKEGGGGGEGGGQVVPLLTDD